MNRTRRARPETTAIDAQHDDAGGAVPSRSGSRIRGSDDRPRTTPPTRVHDLPPLPDAFWQALDPGLAAIGVALDGTQRRQLADHARLLMAWTRTVNLTAIRDPGEVARLHVLDSLTAVPLLRERGVESLVDLGSGGGYPGLPLAVALPARARLVDSIGKKAAFLDLAVDAVDIADRVEVDPRRVEAIAAEPAHREHWPAVTVRAVGPLAELVELGFPLLRPGGVLLAWKRHPGTSELDAGRRATRALGGGSLEVRDPGVGSLPSHRIVVVRKEGPTPDGYPRDPARRKRRPW